jgi:hypothetical protein
MNELFECDDVGDMHDYVGCMVKKQSGELILTQTVMLKSFEDEFDIKSARPVEYPEIPGTVLMPVADDVNAEDSEW